MVIDTILIYHFVDLGLGIEIFFERGKATEKGGVDFKTGSRHICTLGLGLKKNLCRVCLLFYSFFL